MFKLVDVLTNIKENGFIFIHILYLDYLITPKLYWETPGVVLKETGAVTCYK